MWHTQVLAFIKGNGLERFINGDSQCSEQFLPPNNSNRARSLIGNGFKSTNPKYIAWMKIDQPLLSWMLSSIQ